jgi:Mn-containing catalase
MEQQPCLQAAIIPVMFGNYDNVTAEATGRVLAVRLYNMTDDPGMNFMLPVVY